MKNPFSQLFRGKTVIIGIGNVLRGDDALGPVLVQRLQGKIAALCIDAGSAPENYLGKIVKESPDVILMADAVDLQKKPGQWEVLGQEEILKTGFSTHDLSPHMMIEYLNEQTNATIYLLGVQPADLTMGRDLSDPVQKAVDEIERLIKDAGRTHEADLLEPIIRNIADHARVEAATSVSRVRLKVGRSTGVKEEAFREAFRELSQGTPLEDAELDLIFFPGTRIDVFSFDIK